MARSTPGAMTIDDIYRRVQNLFVDKLVTVFGSGASCGYGLPSMSDLAAHLTLALDPDALGLNSRERTTWASILTKLAAEDGLEKTLSRYRLSDRLLIAIRSEIASCVLARETEAIQALIGGKLPNVYGELFERILRVNPIADIVTTNYDRLIEVSAALSSQGVDTMFSGQSLGRLDLRESALEFLQPPLATRRGNPQLAIRSHIRLAKPHGSLDWSSVGTDLYKSDLELGGAPRIIAPTTGKYRESWELDFKAHADRMSTAVRNAKAYLFVGFGFNDEHLQAELNNRFRRVPSLVLSKKLTESALRLITSNSDSIGIEAADDETKSVVHHSAGQTIVTDVDLWRLETLMVEALNEKGSV